MSDIQDAADPASNAGFPLSLIAIFLPPVLGILAAGTGGVMDQSVMGLAVLSILIAHPAITIWIVARKVWTRSLLVTRLSIALSLACAGTWWGMNLCSVRFSEMSKVDQVIWIQQTGGENPADPIERVGSRSGFPFRYIEGLDGLSVYYSLPDWPVVDSSFGASPGIPFKHGLWALLKFDVL